MHIFFLIIFLSILYSKSEVENQERYSKRFRSPVAAGSIQDNVLAEASGLVASKVNKEHFWVINDSGNKPDLHLLDRTGIVVRSFPLSDYENYDWEDLAMITDPASGNSSVLIGDIGDNFAVRTCIQLIQVPEPSIHADPSFQIRKPLNFLLKYEDGPRDAETLMVDPWTNEVYVITKREEQVRLYIAPELKQSSDTLTLAYVGSLVFHNVTAGDISADGTEILVKNYLSIFYWKRRKGESLKNVLMKDHELLNYAPEPQGESIAWTSDANGFYTLSEKSYSATQQLYFYERTTEE